MKNVRDFADTISRISTGFVHSQILFTGINAGVFDFLEKARTAREVADELGWSPRGVRMLLDGLVALELLRKDGQTYSNTEAASECLVEGKEHYQGDIIRHQQNGYEAWGKLSEAVEKGESLEGERRERTPEELQNFILGMSNIGKMSARDMLQGLDLSACTHVLDLGGGPATYSLEMLKANPSMQATVFDMPDVIQIAKGQVAKAGMDERFNFMKGDFTKDDIGSGYDLILVSNIIHSLGTSANRELMRKCAKALVSGGKLLIKDFLTDKDRLGPPFSLVFALRMLLHTPEGDTYPLDEVRQWTRDAGLEDGELIELTPQTRIWVAKKA